MWKQIYRDSENTTRLTESIHSILSLDVDIIKHVHRIYVSGLDIHEVPDKIRFFGTYDNITYMCRIDIPIGYVFRFNQTISTYRTDIMYVYQISGECRNKNKYIIDFADCIFELGGEFRILLPDYVRCVKLLKIEKINTWIYDRYNSRDILVRNGRQCNTEYGIIYTYIRYMMDDKYYILITKRTDNNILPTISDNMPIPYVIFDRLMIINPSNTCYPIYVESTDRIII